MTQRNAHTMIELTVSLTVVGILLTLLIPAISSARAAARNTACKNRMRQIGFALDGHSIAFSDQVPASATKINHGVQESWIVNILPWIEGAELHDAFEEVRSENDFEDVFMDSTIPNRPLTLLRCPSEVKWERTFIDPASSKYAELIQTTSFRASAGVTMWDFNHIPFLPLNHPFARTDRRSGYFESQPCSRSSIKDGESNTIRVTEFSNSGFGSTAYNRPAGIWFGRPSAVGDWEITQLFYINGYAFGAYNSKKGARDKGFSSMHGKGGNCLFGDGSVKFISWNTDQRLLASYVDKADGVRAVNKN